MGTLPSEMCMMSKLDRLFLPGTLDPPYNGFNLNDQTYNNWCESLPSPPSHQPSTSLSPSISPSTSIMPSPAPSTTEHREEREKEIEKEIEGERKTLITVLTALEAERFISDATSHCNWDISYCNEDGFVTGISLYNEGLRGSIPTEV
eukprot:13342175-Ditylum_brightwellii.AAC.1